MVRRACPSRLRAPARTTRMSSEKRTKGTRASEVVNSIDEVRCRDDGNGDLKAPDKVTANLHRSAGRAC